MAWLQTTRQQRGKPAAVEDAYLVAATPLPPDRHVSRLPATKPACQRSLRERADDAHARRRRAHAPTGGPQTSCAGWPTCRVTCPLERPRSLEAHLSGTTWSLSPATENMRGERQEVCRGSRDGHKRRHDSRSEHYEHLVYAATGGAPGVLRLCSPQSLRARGSTPGRLLPPAVWPVHVSALSGAPAPAPGVHGLRWARTAAVPAAPPSSAGRMPDLVRPQLACSPTLDWCSQPKRVFLGR